MGIGILATFDGELEASVRKTWAALEAEGIGTTPSQLGERPHVSLFLGKDEDEGRAMKVFESVPRPRIDLLLEPLGIFLSPKPVLYLSVMPNDKLLSFHRGLHDKLEAAGILSDPFYIPGACNFHCTLAIDLEKDDLCRAIAVIEAQSAILRGRIEGIELIRYFPAEAIATK
jgi:hypothetical protein